MKPKASYEAVLFNINSAQKDNKRFAVSYIKEVVKSQIEIALKEQRKEELEFLKREYENLKELGIESTPIKKRIKQLEEVKNDK